MAQLGHTGFVRELVREKARVEPTVLRLVRSLAVQDWVVLTYFAILLFALVNGQGATRDGSIIRVAGDVALFLTGVILTRGGILRAGSLAAGLVYRTAVLTSLVASYLQLREILPAVSSRALDAEILAFDLRVFGYEPAIAWDRFVTPATTEWFAFFYFLYFLLLVVHIIPMALFDRSSRRLAWFVLGTVFVFCLGHIGYMIVPGYGPHRYLEGRFENPLEGGLFWRAVVATVRVGGAQKDIFPSLHTAAPTWFAIFSFMNRDARPFKYTWPVVAFMATQIMIATMFLRWHWVADVVVGLLLAFGAAFASKKIAAWDDARRKRAGLAPIFTPLVSETPFEPENVEISSIRNARSDARRNSC